MIRTKTFGPGQNAGVGPQPLRCNTLEADYDGNDDNDDNALLVKAHWEGEIGILELYLSFYPRTNISDENFNHAPHFSRIHIFQIYLLGTKWTYFDFTFYFHIHLSNH